MNSGSDILARASRLEEWRGATSIEQLAVWARVSGRTVQNWLAGVTIPRADHAARIEARQPGFMRALGLALDLDLDTGLDQRGST